MAGSAWQDFQHLRLRLRQTAQALRWPASYTDASACPAARLSQEIRPFLSSPVSQPLGGRGHLGHTATCSPRVPRELPSSSQLLGDRPLR